MLKVEPLLLPWKSFLEYCVFSTVQSVLYTVVHLIPRRLHRGFTVKTSYFSNERTVTQRS